ncbi:MAG TPA: hypothetical protein VFN35_25160, partial [Ktedonobacteraceae bacterium]|nr:hypothetical protein [Ktedonobacteraceae bacterium]
MAHTDKFFNAKDIEQQLDQHLSQEKGSPRMRQAQLLTELHRFHQEAANAEKYSLATAWERIERRSGSQPEQFAPEAPSMLYLPERRTSEHRQGSRQRRLLAIVAAVLVALTLIGGSLTLIQKGRESNLAAQHTPTPGPLPTPTPQERSSLIYTNQNADAGMMLS